MTTSSLTPTRLFVFALPALLLAIGQAACGGDSGAVGIDPRTGAPIGNGATCSAADECGGETPLCNGDGACVECTDAAQCEAGELCTTRGFCGECDADADCGAGGICDLVEGDCVDCQSDSDCPADEPVCTPEGDCQPACPATGCAEGLCHPTLNTCVECAADADCGAGDPLCDPKELECVECLDASDCGAGSPFCIDGDCEECVQNTDCGVGELCNDDLECVSTAGCTTNADCDGDQECDVELGACFECVTDAHCAGLDPETVVCVANRCEECRGNEDCPADAPLCIENGCE